METTTLRNLPCSPVLPENMIPIRYQNGLWVVADIEDRAGPCAWYDYEARRWANCAAVRKNGKRSREEYLRSPAGTPVDMDDILLMLVWIPRYRYRLFNAANDGSTSARQEIDIQFESPEGMPSYGGNEPTADRIYLSGRNGEYLTHPAFRFKGKELSGFWVGKFEPSGEVGEMKAENGDTTSLVIKPNMVVERDQNVRDMFFTSRSMCRPGNEFGLTSDADTHMMQCFEWGAVAYLTNSRYGLSVNGEPQEIYINNSLSYITGNAADNANDPGVEGCPNPYDTPAGQKASTTGTIEGVYDLCGCAFEYMMTTVRGADGLIHAAESGFDEDFLNSEELKPYLDVIDYGCVQEGWENICRGRLGDATKEIVHELEGFGGGWFGDHSVLVFSDEPVLPGDPRYSPRNPSIYHRTWMRRGGEANTKTYAGILDFGRDPGHSKGERYTWRAVVTAE